MKILLDYVFPITVITPTPAASTGFLKRVCLVCKPKTGQEGNVGTMYTCNSSADVALRTDNENADQLFAAGMSQVFILLSADLDVADAMTTYKSEFYTLLISDDYDDDDITASPATLVKAGLTFTAVKLGDSGNAISVAFIAGGTAGSEVVTVTGKAISVSMDTTVSTALQLKTALDAKPEALALITTAIGSGQSGVGQAAFAAANLTGGDGFDFGVFEGVIGLASTDADFCAAQVALANRCAFFTTEANGATNLCFAFGSLLANASNWLNQQYISMPVDDGVDDLGDANSLFDNKVSFVISDDEFGNRLALFSMQGQAIVAPYILKNMRIDLQSRALQWISQNMPQYTIKEASLLETRLQEDVINTKYIDTGLVESGSVAITLVNANFVANGSITVPQPKALWRVVSEMTETV